MKENGDETGEAPIENKKTIEQYLEEIKKACSIYAKMIHRNFKNEHYNRHFRNLQSILSKPSYIFLMHLMQLELPEKDTIEILKAIETFMLRRHICEWRTGEHDEIFAKLVKQLDSANMVESVTKALKEDMPVDEDFKISFPKHHFKGRLVDRAKYVLEQIEYYKTGDTGEITVNLGRDVHLEHIIPETITTKKSKREFGNWEEYLGANANVKHRKFVHLIGNMTLLAGYLNITASNNPFGMKKKCYKKSSINLTRELSKLANFKFYNVNKRGEELSDLALKIWNL